MGVHQRHCRWRRRAARVLGTERDETGRSCGGQYVHRALVRAQRTPTGSAQDFAQRDQASGLVGAVSQNRAAGLDRQMRFVRPQEQ